MDVHYLTGVEPAVFDPAGFFRRVEDEWVLPWPLHLPKAQHPATFPAVVKSNGHPFVDERDHLTGGLHSSTLSGTAAIRGQGYARLAPSQRQHRRRADSALDLAAGASPASFLHRPLSGACRRKTSKFDVVSWVAEELASHLAAQSTAPSLRGLRDRFRREGYLELSQFAPEALAARLRLELTAILDRGASRREVTIAATGGTPRRYGIVTRDAIEQSCALIPDLYRAPALLAFLAAIVGRELVPVPYLPEQFIATRMARSGDSHGWHWDDYPYALVWVIRAPEHGCGGDVELVRDTKWNKSRPEVERYLRERTIARLRPRSGSAYLLRADTTMHRVAPLSRDTLRDVLTFSYTDVDDDRGDITHETLEMLLGS